tara:strand:+ start:102 stop:497 length:396 start_codon:yes stop_codon:yes gene_type:complete
MLGKIDEGEQLVARSKTKRCPPEKKERNVGTNPRRNAMANGTTQLIGPETRQCTKHCGGIGTATTQPRFQRNPFVDYDRKITWCTTAYYTEGSDGRLPRKVVPASRHRRVATSKFEGTRTDRNCQIISQFD